MHSILPGCCALTSPITMVDTKLDFLVQKVLNRFTDLEVHIQRERERHADIHSQENSTRVDPNGWTMQPPLRCAASVMPADALNQPSKQAPAREKPMLSLPLSLLLLSLLLLSLSLSAFSPCISDLCEFFDTDEGQRGAYHSPFQGKHWTVEIALPLANLVQETGSNAQTQQVDLYLLMKLSHFGQIASLEDGLGRPRPKFLHDYGDALAEADVRR